MRGLGLRPVSLWIAASTAELVFTVREERVVHATTLLWADAPPPACAALPPRTTNPTVVIHGRRIIPRTSGASPRSLQTLRFLESARERFVTGSVIRKHPTRACVVLVCAYFAERER